MIQTFFERYGSLEDVRVILDQKKSKQKKYGFVLYKERSALNEVVKLGSKIEIAPGVLIDCKQTLLREELKQKQLQDSDQSRPMTSAERKIIKRAKKKIKRLQAKLDSLKELGKDGRDLQTTIDRETKILRSIKMRLKLTDDQEENSSDKDANHGLSQSITIIGDLNRTPSDLIEPTMIFNQPKYHNLDHFSGPLRHQEYRMNQFEYPIGMNTFQQPPHSLPIH